MEVDVTNTQQHISKPLPPHVERMYTEHKDLVARLVKLEGFVQHNPVFRTLPDVEREDMVEQLRAMKIYENVLYRRMVRAAGSS